MNEFEWLRQMRELRQPKAPRRDLWASIDAAMVDAGGAGTPLPRAARRWHWLPASAIAASLLLAGGIGWRQWQTPVSTPIAHATNPVNWKPSDPRLAGAAVELDAAQMELQLAIRQAPDSPSLQRLLDRTELQQTQLRLLAHQAG